MSKLTTTASPGLSGLSGIGPHADLRSIDVDLVLDGAAEERRSLDDAAPAVDGAVVSPARSNVIRSARTTTTTAAPRSKLVPPGARTDAMARANKAGSVCVLLDGSFEQVGSADEIGDES